jgi:hypothetical protein
MDIRDIRQVFQGFFDFLIQMILDRLGYLDFNACDRQFHRDFS